MFLQSLGKYLDYKVELKQLDSTYAYARASLLHYARWMAEHEVPTLSRLRFWSTRTRPGRLGTCAKVKCSSSPQSTPAVQKAKFLERARLLLP